MSKSWMYSASALFFLLTMAGEVAAMTVANDFTCSPPPAPRVCALPLDATMVTNVLNKCDPLKKQHVVGCVEPQCTANPPCNPNQDCYSPNGPPTFHMNIICEPYNKRITKGYLGCAKIKTTTQKKSATKPVRTH